MFDIGEKATGPSRSFPVVEHKIVRAYKWMKNYRLRWCGRHRDESASHGCSRPSRAPCRSRGRWRACKWARSATGFRWPSLPGWVAMATPRAYPHCCWTPSGSCEEPGMHPLGMRCVPPRGALRRRCAFALTRRLACLLIQCKIARKRWLVSI